jgi:putative DNA primase/helicase
MTYLGSGDNGIHATQLSVTASLAGQGVAPDEIVSVVLGATEIAAGPAGVAWNWKREEKAIADMARSAVAKFAPREKPTGAAAEAQEKVVRLHPRAQAKPDEETSPDAIVRNDRGNAQILVEEHGHDMRYVIGMGWHVWDGKRYRHDPENVEIGRLAHLVHQKLLAGASNDKALKWAIQAGNSSRLKNMTHEARPYVSCASEDLNADPFLLNCGNGTLDLRSGLLREHRQSDLITKLVPTSYDPGALCPTWDAFLLSIFGGDTDLVDFLQRIVGYSMTADCREQVIFILFGLGSNGKSVLIEVLSFLLADYVKHSPSDTFAAKKYGGGIPNDLAGFAGARLVSVIETEQGHGLAEGLVKQATGGDKMAVRFLHKEFFDLVPKFKLWLATNHKPVIKGSDLAIWRRIRLLPFNETFVDADKATAGQKVKDLDLKAKLLVELPGVLAWATRGCRAWLERGLRVPGAVEKATKLYQESQNPVTKFVAEACWVDPSCHCEASTLYDAFENWCRVEEEELISKKRFGMTLEENGFAPFRGSHGNRLRKGLDLTSETRGTMESAKQKGP